MMGKAMSKRSGLRGRGYGVPGGSGVGPADFSL